MRFDIGSILQETHLVMKKLLLLSWLIVPWHILTQHNPWLDWLDSTIIISFKLTLWFLGVELKDILVDVQRFEILLLLEAISPLEPIQSVICKLLGDFNKIMELAQVLNLKFIRNIKAVWSQACVLIYLKSIELFVNILYLTQSLDHTVAHGVQGRSKVMHNHVSEQFVFHQLFLQYLIFCCKVIASNFEVKIL